MSLLVRVVVFSLLVLFSSACTYHGNLGEKALVEDKAVGNKIPINIAIIENSSLKSRPFVSSSSGHGVEINYSDCLLRTLYIALNNKFRYAKVLPSAQKNDEFNIFITYEIKFREISRDSWSGRHVYLCLLNLNFIRPDTKFVIASIDNQEQIVFTPPGAVTAAAFLDGLSLFLLTPLTTPIKTQAIGSRAEELIEFAIKESVISIMNKIDLNPQLAAIATSLSEGSHGSEKAKIKTPIAPTTQPPSKYDDFLNAVVVVKTSKGVGSGFFVSSDGYLVTNQHVVGSEKKVAIKMRNGPVVLGTVVSSDPYKDIAIVTSPYKPTAWLQLSDAGEGGIGAEVLAIGCPEGLSWSVSKGIISAYRQNADTEIIQTDVAINPGSSGGPLVLLDSGKVVGVNTFGFEKSKTEGLNFAISSKEIKKYLPSLGKR